jgi:quinol monooxygenase YgiN
MFEVTAKMRVRDGELDGFEQQAAEMMRLTRKQDEKTLRYDWFISEAGAECEVREGYVDADGLLEHNTHIREARHRLFRGRAFGHDMTIYDKPSPALAELMEQLAGHVAFNRFSFFRGLNGDRPTALLARGTQGGPAMFEATARLKIRKGKLEGFKRQAADLIGQMRAQDERPLRYDWFLIDDGTECEVREAYVDADALLAHQQKVAAAKMKLFGEFLDGHTMTFYGELSPALAGALQTMGTPYQRFSFLQGLDADITVREEVPAKPCLPPRSSTS